MLPLLLILSHSWSSHKALLFWRSFVAFLHFTALASLCYLCSCVNSYPFQMFSLLCFILFLMTLTTLVPVHLKQTHPKAPTKIHVTLILFLFFKCRLYFHRVVFQFTQLGLLNCSIGFAEYNLDWLLVWWPKIVPSLIQFVKLNSTSLMYPDKCMYVQYLMLFTYIHILYLYR